MMVHSKISFYKDLRITTCALFFTSSQTPSTTAGCWSKLALSENQSLSIEYCCFTLAIWVTIGDAMWFSVKSWANSCLVSVLWYSTACIEQGMILNEYTNLVWVISSPIYLMCTCLIKSTGTWFWRIIVPTTVLYMCSIYRNSRLYSSRTSYSLLYCQACQQEHSYGLYMKKFSGLKRHFNFLNTSKILGSSNSVSLYFVCGTDCFPLETLMGHCAL